MKKIHPEELEVTLEQIVAKKASHFQHVAIDGKSIRNTNQSAEDLLHLLSAYAPEIKGVLLQSKSGVGEGEIISAKKLLSKITLKDKVITRDALFAQEVLCSKITKASGNYVFKVKKNKKRIVYDIEQSLCLYRNKNV